MNRQKLWAILNKAEKENNISNVGSHSMRKTFGYFLYKNNVSMRYIGITQEDKDLAVISLKL